MKTMSLQDRIERSRKIVSTYPEWVRTASKFQGGGVVREHNEMQESDQKKVIKVMESI